jgi:hypothetical protein
MTAEAPQAALPPPSPLFKKLNLTDQREIFVFAAPDSFQAELTGLRGRTVRRDQKKPRDVRFALAFAMRQAEVDAISALLAAAATGDALLWMAYPKGSSKRYLCDFNRDRGWNVLREKGFDTVRQVAIDEDWSALRFRRQEYIKSGAGRARG